MAQLVGPRVAVQQAVELAGLGPEVERLGPLPWAGATRFSGSAGSVGPVGSVGSVGPKRSNDRTEDQPRVQLLLRTSLADGPSLAAALIHMKALRSARKDQVTVGVRVDPGGELG